MNWSVQQWKLPYEFLRILSIFRGKFYCLSLATVAVDIDVKTLKENGILLSQFAQNVAEVCYRRLSLKRGFGGCRHGFGRCDGLGGLGRLGGFDGVGGFGGFEGFSAFGGFSWLDRFSWFGGFDGISGFNG